MGVKATTSKHLQGPPVVALSSGSLSFIIFWQYGNYGYKLFYNIIVLLYTYTSIS